MSKFEVYKDVKGFYRWRLKASNGEIVATSEAYVTKQSAISSAQRVEIWAQGSKVYDLT